VYVGDTVYAKAKVKSLIPEKKRVVLETLCLVKDAVVLEGEAVLQLPA